MKIVVEVLREAVDEMFSWLHNNLRNIAAVFDVLCPYVSMWAAITAYMERGKLAFGGEWFVPIVFFVSSSILKAIANKTGKGITIPRPRKRFTTEEDGEVTVDVDRTEELLLYVADLEDWLERKGLL